MDETSTENARPSAATNIADGWQRFEEPLWKTLVRNVGIAAAVGAVLALSRRRLSSAGLFTILALWFTLGGHYIEVLFLNVVRGQLPKTRRTQVIARLAVWFVGGCVLFDRRNRGLTEILHFGVTNEVTASVIFSSG